MPFAANSELPKRVRDVLPPSAQSQFRAVVNAVLDDGGSEASAFRQAWGAIRQNWKPGTDGDKWVRKMEKFTTHGTITKVDEDQHTVTGWASIIEEDGKAVVDLQGDVIEEPELVLMAHKFIADVRAGKAMHSGRRVGTVVESLVMTKDLQEALGIDLGKIGWMITMKVHDDDVWERVKSGELQAFSIGGFMERTEVKGGE